MKVWSPFTCTRSIHSCHFHPLLSLNGLFTQTSRGCSILVIPPGIMGGTVFRRASMFFTGFIKWPLNESHTRIDFHFISPPTLDQREFSQFLTRASSIQPFSWHLTSKLLGNLTFFGRVFLLKTTYGGSFDPSPLHASITVKRSFSCPVVMIGTVVIPEAKTVVFDAMPKASGV